MFAITRASLRAILRSPSAVVFSFAFPLMFILIFGFIGGGGKTSIKVAVNKNADTLNPVYGAMKTLAGLNFVTKSDTEITSELQKGRLTAIIDVQKVKTEGSSQNPGTYQIKLKSSESVNPQNLQLLTSLLNGMVSNLNNINYPNTPTVAEVSQDVQKIPGRTFRTIDFILPGQLGFSLLSAGVFGVAFLFFNLRQQLVLKRFFATPIKRSYIVLGEALSRVLFQMSTAVVIVLIGALFFNYTLVNGVTTFLEIMVLSFLALVVFMGYGFIVSGLAKNESTIPPFANLFTLPQFLLAGTFFSIDVFPTWLQPVCKVLPLTHFNDAMRLIAFEGAHLTDCWKQVGILLIWGVITYGVAIKVFKWE